MISTQHLQTLPEITRLRQICIAIAVLDAIICPEWQYRYYSYNAKWAEGEECATMRDGSGDEYLILFNQGGAIINGQAHEMKPLQVRKEHIPEVFQDFIFGEPVKSIGASFIIFRMYGDTHWQAISNGAKKQDANSDGAEDLLFILDGQPQTYKAWAEEYYEEELESEIPLEAVQWIYEGKELSKEIVLLLNPSIESLEVLGKDLDEIAYPYSF
jgi:hypothetical protein